MVGSTTWWLTSVLAGPTQTLKDLKSQWVLGGSFGPCQNSGSPLEPSFTAAQKEAFGFGHPPCVCVIFLPGYDGCHGVLQIFAGKRLWLLMNLAMPLTRGVAKPLGNHPGQRQLPERRRNPMFPRSCIRSCCTRFNYGIQIGAGGTQRGQADGFDLREMDKLQGAVCLGCNQINQRALPCRHFEAPVDSSRQHVPAVRCQ